MEFSIQRETLLNPLQLISGAVEKKQTLPILSNVLLSLEDGALSLTATDLEVELVGRVPCEDVAVAGRITVPARKLVDICRSLPDSELVTLALDRDRLLLKSGRSRFALATLSADDFPAVEDEPAAHTFTLSERSLRQLIEKTYFAMAQQDVRYYLNGMLFHVGTDRIEMVATDGHRLAQCVLKNGSVPMDSPVQVIVPRKGIMELMRLLSSDSDDDVTVHVGEHHIRVVSDAFTFTSKLIEGRFPDYGRVIPKKPAHQVLVDRQVLKQALTRVAILSHDKHRGVRLVFGDNTLKIFANNSEKETAEETVSIDYPHASVEVGFNVNYIQDVLGAMDTPLARLSFTDGNSSVLIEADCTDDSDTDAAHVIMPMRL